MQIDSSTLKSGHYCTLGWVVSAPEPSCPLTHECPYYQPRQKTGQCKSYQGPIAYSSLYNVYSRIQRRFDDPAGGYLFTPIMAMREGDEPLAIVRFTDRGNFLAYIDGVSFSPKLRWITAQPTVFLKEGVGFRIENVHAIEIDFPEVALHKFVRRQLENDVLLRQWIALKRGLYLGPDDVVLRERRGISAFRKMETVVTAAVEGTGIENAQESLSELGEVGVTDALVNFGAFLLLHSFAHTFRNALLAKYGCRGEELAYSIEHPLLRTVGAPAEKVRILVFETAEGGFGYLRTFATVLGSGETDEFEHLLKASFESIKQSCEDRVDQSIRNLERNYENFRDEAKLRPIVDGIIRAYRNSFKDSKVFPHVNAIRRAIATSIDVPNEIRPLLDDLLERGAHCWDGCQLCVMLERECTFLAFDQPFLVSERLLRSSLQLMYENLRNPMSFYPLRRGISDEFHRLTSMATSTINVVTPWISPEIVDYLQSLESQKQVKVRIITRHDRANDVQSKSIEKLRELDKKLGENFQTRIIDQLHAKGIIIDGIMAMHGSFNLTVSGLNSNVENITIDFSVVGTSKFAKEFETVWQKANAL